eukprot:3018353-Pyramimonas_sp.AAC.2
MCVCVCAKSGASQPHGHAQMVLTRDYLGKAHALRTTAMSYTPVPGAPSMPGEHPGPTQHPGRM